MSRIEGTGKARARAQHTAAPARRYVEGFAQNKDPARKTAVMNIEKKWMKGQQPKEKIYKYIIMLEEEDLLPESALEDPYFQRMRRESAESCSQKVRNASSNFKSERQRRIVDACTQLAVGLVSACQVSPDGCTAIDAVVDMGTEGQAAFLVLGPTALTRSAPQRLMGGMTAMAKSLKRSGFIVVLVPMDEVDELDSVDDRVAALRGRLDRALVKSKAEAAT
eukprot:gene8845-84_t